MTHARTNYFGLFVNVTSLFGQNNWISLGFQTFFESLLLVLSTPNGARDKPMVVMLWTYQVIVKSCRRKKHRVRAVLEIEL